MMKKIILLSIVVNYSVVSGWGNNQQYNNAALNSAYQAIQQKAINVSTGEVFSRAGTETDVARCFEEEFLTDPVEDARISEQRKVQRSMALIRAVSRARTVSGLSLEVSDLRETIALDFQNKQEALEAEKDGLWGKKVLLGCGIASGVGVLAFGIAARDKSSKQICCGVGAVTVVGSSCALYSTMGKEEQLKTHIVRVKTMKDDWENSFKK